MAAQGGMIPGALEAVLSRAPAAEGPITVRLDLLALQADDEDDRADICSLRQQQTRWSHEDRLRLRAWYDHGGDAASARDLAVRLTRRLGGALLPAAAGATHEVTVDFSLDGEPLTLRLPRDAFEVHAHLTGLERARGLGCVLAQLRHLHREYGAPFAGAHDSLLVATVSSPGHLLDVAEEGRVPSAAVADLSSRLHAALRIGLVAWDVVAPLVDKLTTSDLVRSPRNRTRLQSLQRVVPLDDTLAARVFGDEAAKAEWLRDWLRRSAALASSPVLQSMQEAATFPDRIPVVVTPLAATATDHTALVRLLDQVGIEPERRALDHFDPTLSFVAVDERGRLVGMVAAHASTQRADTVYVPWIAVEGLQRRGVGLALMRSLLMATLGGGYRGLMGTSQARHPAQGRFYDHLGSRRVQHTPASADRGAQWVHAFALDPSDEPAAPLHATALLSGLPVTTRLSSYAGDLVLQRGDDGGQRRRLPGWAVDTDDHDRLLAPEALREALAALPLGERLRVLDHLRPNGSRVEHVATLRTMAVTWRHERISHWLERTEAARRATPRWLGLDQAALEGYVGPELRRLAADDPAAVDALARRLST